MLSVIQFQTARDFLGKVIVDVKGLHVSKQPEKFAPLGGAYLRLIDYVDISKRLVIEKNAPP